MSVKYNFSDFGGGKLELFPQYIFTYKIEAFYFSEYAEKYGAVVQHKI